MLYTYTHNAKHDTDTHTKHIAQQSYIHFTQMMITTTAIHTQYTNDDYNNNHTYIVHKQWLQSKSSSEKDEFSKHFSKSIVNLYVLDQMVGHSM